MKVLVVTKLPRKSIKVWVFVLPTVCKCKPLITHLNVYLDV